MPEKTPKGEKHYDSNTVAGPASYDPSAKPTVTASDLVAIEGDEDADANVTGGFEGEVASTDGNVVHVQVNEVADPATTSGGQSSLVEVNSGTDLSAENVSVTAHGY